MHALVQQLILSFHLERSTEAGKVNLISLTFLFLVIAYSLISSSTFSIEWGNQAVTISFGGQTPFKESISMLAVFVSASSLCLYWLVAGANHNIVSDKNTKKN